MRIFDNIRKITTGQGDDYTTGCLLEYPYFKDNYKTIAKDLSKQKTLDADPKAIHQITGNLNRRGDATIFFILKEVKQTIFYFLQGTVRVL